MAFTKAIVAVAALSVVQVAQAWHVELPPCVDEFKPFVYSGCYQDGNPNALIYRSSVSKTGMTVEKCIAECKGNGFRYAGLKYYGECYCGATVNGAQLEESKCNLKCDGNKDEACGGNSALSVWQDPTFEADNSKVTIENYVSLGCYTDDDSTPGPTLSWPQKLDTATFTTEKCLAACKANGFPIAGTEYGQECYCGSVLANNTVSAPASECNINCKGDASKKCGGRNRLSLYVAKELQSLQPCGYQPPKESSSSVITVSTSSAVPETSSSEVAESTTSSEDAQSTTVEYEVSTTSSAAAESTTSSAAAESTTSSAAAESTTSSAAAESTTSAAAESTTSSAAAESTTSSAAAESTTSSAAAGATTSSQAAITSTTSAGVSSIPATSTTSAALCTATITKPSECEYKCGNWCAPSIPDWQDKEDCLEAAKSCTKNVASCLKKAGWPGVLNCFDFSKWCSGVTEFCHSDVCKSKGKCNKKSCFDKYTPVAPKPPAVTTSVYPCPATSTAAQPSSTKPAVPTTCAPEPTNVCKQPSNSKYNYGPGNPVGGIELPLVGCNDFLSEWKQTPFKLYIDENTRKCKTYTRPQCGNACTDACKEQYESCKNVYVESCKKFGWNSYFHRREVESSMSDVEKRFFNIFGTGKLFGGAKDSFSQANDKCTVQYNECVAINKNINPGNRCTVWGKGY